MALLPNHKNLNILLLGETGVGKSTFINAFANYFNYTNFDEALKANEPICVIPSRHEITFADFKRLKIKNYGINRVDIENENIFEEASSATKKPRIYSFFQKNIKFNFIDVPGNGSTYGIFRDMENKKYITAALKKLKKIHGILILIKASDCRLSPEFKNRFNEIFMLFDASAAPNIMFVFTNSRGSNYLPGAALRTLNSYLTEMKEMNGVTIKVNENNAFTVDNEAYKFQCGWNKSEEYRNEFKKSFDNYKKSWNQSKNEISKILFRIFNSEKEYDTISMLRIEEARTFIFNENYSLCCIKKLQQGHQNFVEALLNFQNQKIIFDDIFKQYQNVNFNPKKEYNFEITDNMCFNILSTNQRISLIVPLQFKENAIEKAIFKNIIDADLTLQDAENFVRLLETILQNDAAFIENAIPKLSQYLKKNSIISYNDAIKERMNLEIIKEQSTLEMKREKFRIVPQNNDLDEEIQKISAGIVKLRNLSIFYLDGIKAIKDSNECGKIVEETDFQQLFSSLNNLSHNGINIKRLYETNETDNNDANVFEKFKLLQIYLIKFKAALYFSTNFHHQIIFVRENDENSSIPFLKALINNFDCFFIEDCFAFDVLQQPKRYLLEIMDQMFAITDLPIIPSQAVQGQNPAEIEIQNILSNIDKISAICLFIKIDNPNQEIQLKDYLSNFSKNDFDKIYFILNYSNSFSVSNVKDIFFQLKHTVESYNKNKNVNIKFENENVFIFNNNAIEELMALLETEEDVVKIPELLYENCKNSVQEIQRFFTVLFKNLPPKVKSFKVKVGEKVIYSVTLKEFENVTKVLAFHKKNTETTLEIKKNSVKVIKNFTLPTSNFIILKLSINWNENISVEILPLYNSVTISQDNVEFYNSVTDELSSFPSSIDYLDSNAIVGINYDSPTVVKDAIISLGLTTIPKKLSKVMTSFTLRGFPELLFSIPRAQTPPHFVNPESVIAELLKEATKNIENNETTLLLTIPRHFTAPQKAAYTKAAEYANLPNIKFVDEISAFAYGFEMIHKIPENLNYVLIHYFYPNFIISTVKSGIIDKKEITTIQIEADNFREWETNFFDMIISDAQKNDADIKYKFSNEMNQLFERVSAEISETIPDCFCIVLSESKFLHKVFTDFFSNIYVFSIQSSEDFIATGANLAFNINEK